MPESAMAVPILLLALFVGPQLFDSIGSISVDPLMAIMGLFGLLAVLQQLGFQMSDGAGPASEHRGRGPGQRGGDPDSGGAAAKTPEGLLEEAERCQAQNNYGRVQELAKEATDLDPECARAWELLALAQKWEGRREEAAATVKRARDLYEVQSDGLTKLSRELEEAEDPEATVLEAKAKADDFFARRQYDMATECYSKAIEVLGNQATREQAMWVKLHRRRAECAQQVQDWATVRRDTTVVLEAEPADAGLLLQRAAANEALERFKPALEDARRLLALDPKSKAANRIVHNCQQALRA